jgi:HAD superfamily hydrolase (TIGR01458 family)
LAALITTLLESMIVTNPTLLLFDIEGTLHVADQPIAGAVDALCALRQAGYQIRFTTNTTTKTAEQLRLQLQHCGFELEASELFSPPQVARSMLFDLQGQYKRPLRLWPVVAEAVLSEFSDFITDTLQPDVVLLGDIGDGWNWPLINRVFATLQAGAQLMTLHRNRFWQTAAGLHVDIGFIVAGFEAVTGQSAQVIGKPSAQFFQQVIASSGVLAHQAMMVGDDLLNDVAGAQAVGMRGVLVQTGKFRPNQLFSVDVVPDAVLSSVADLPSWLAMQPLI